MPVDNRATAEEMATLSERVESLEDGGDGGGGAVDSVDGQTGDVDLSDVYAPLASSFDRSALYLNNGSGEQAVGDGSTVRPALVVTSDSPGGVGLVGTGLSFEDTFRTITFEEAGVYSVTWYLEVTAGGDGGVLESGWMGWSNSDDTASITQGLTPTGYMNDWQSTMTGIKYWEADDTVILSAGFTATDTSKHVSVYAQGIVERLA